MTEETNSAPSLVRPVERDLTRIVIDQFVNQRQAATKQQLISAAYNRSAIDRTMRFGLFRDVGNQNYAPTVLGCELCADSHVLRRLRRATEVVLNVLRQLAKEHGVDQRFTAADVEKKAQEMSPGTALDNLKFGLFLAQEFAISAGGGGIEVSYMVLDDRIFETLWEIDHAWDRLVADRSEFLKGARSPERVRAFLSNLYELAGHKQVDISSRRWFQAAHGAGFQNDEIPQLIEECVADGVLHRDLKSDAVSLTDAAFAQERDRAAQLTVLESGSIIFISCGQSPGVEKELGKQIASLVRALGFQAFFAEEVQDLDGLDASILRALHDCAAFITVLHPRGDITTPDGKKVTRASVWIEQEIAIAAYIQRVEKRKLHVIAFKHKDVSLEGLRSLLHLNPISFTTETEIILKLPERLNVLREVQVATEVTAQSAEDWLEQ